MDDVHHTVEKMLKMRTLVLTGALLPGVGCYLCVAYTYLFQFDNVLNFTQGQVCHNVHNFLPPISYSIGVWEPQRFFWLLIMFLHTPPRMFFLVVRLLPFTFLSERKQVKLYRRLFLHSSPIKYGWFKTLISFFMVTMWLEIAGLVTVTVFPVKLFWVHSMGFSIWITAFNINVFLNIILHHFGGLKTTFWVKIFLLIGTFSFTILTAITFPIFVNFCSNIAYITFSIAEYALVGLNSVFYCIIYWEFPRTRITIGVHTKTLTSQLSTSTTCTKIEKEPV